MHKGHSSTKILSIGRKQVPVSLSRLLIKQDHIEIADVLTDSHLQGSPTAVAVQELGLPLYTFDTALEAMREGCPEYDLGLSIPYWRELRDEFLSILTLGTINFHPALLPEYKGTGGYNLAIMDELDQWGNTAHHADASIDTGEIIGVDRFPIDAEAETTQSLERKTMQVLEPFAQRIIARAIESKTKLPITSNIGGRYVSRDKMETMKQILDGDNIKKKTRAFWFPPYDGIYTEINGQKYILINRQLLEEIAPKGSTSLFAGKTNV